MRRFARCSLLLAFLLLASVVVPVPAAAETGTTELGGNGGCDGAGCGIAWEITC